ncbi:transposase [Sphingomonas sp. CGMCC 1.13654]|uniref:Transposase n=1 Tax=Sphingomonas chungangi TaxID=2683589 RepID=A0A838L9Y1_9SPHN|nr:transposase [Sphingomonas chungangi]MBA2934926.1 transposase [Sphingomonas chungangi]MVW58237.1 transposase [Sphingomonas chungangi]
MPRLIDPGPRPAPITLEEAVERLTDLGFDPEAEGAWDAAAPILAALCANREFLAASAIEELKRGGARDGRDHYGPQVIMLARGPTNWFLRANMWPAEGDAILRASGRSAFFYDLPHDHNFSFLTVGHHGPGYESDYWEYDGEALTLQPDEATDLRYTGRHRLEPGRIMLYRAHRDVHDQKPPAAFSVTLNIMESSGREPWRNQYRFDPASGRVDRLLNTTAIEGLLPLAAHMGGGNGEDLLHHLMRRHPVDRIRIGAMQALAGVTPDAVSRHALLDGAARLGDPAVSGAAIRALADLPGILAWAAGRSETDA